MKALILMSLFLLVSCGSGQKKKTIQEGQPQDEFSHLSNDNFVSPDPILLDETNDFFEDADDDYLNSAESLQFAEEDDLEDYNESSIEGMMSLCYRRNFTEFQKTFSAINRQYRKHPGFWNAVGSCHLLQGNKKKALLYYNKSRDLAPKYVPPINNLGVLYMHRGEHKKALLAFKKAESMASFSITPMLNQVMIFTQFGLVDKAKKLAENLYRLNRDDPNVVSSYAYVSLLEKNYNRALNLYSSMDRDYRKNPKIALNFAAGLALNNNLDDAKDVLDDMRQPTSSLEKRYYSTIMSYINKRSKK